jgi:hypothetical protein
MSEIRKLVALVEQDENLQRQSYPTILSTRALIEYKTLISLLSEVRTEYREYGNISGRLQRKIDNAISEEE